MRVLLNFRLTGRFYRLLRTKKRKGEVSGMLSSEQRDNKTPNRTDRSTRGRHKSF